MLKSFALAFSLSAAALTAQTSYFSAFLDGAHQVPPVSTSATGWGVVAFDAQTSTVKAFLRAIGIPAIAAHIHVAPPGVNGPLIVNLVGGPEIWSGTMVLSPRDAGLLLSGDTYLNVHTVAKPGGEIRGQLVPATSERYGASLDGLQEVPPNLSTATGSAVLFLHEPDNVVTYVVESVGLVNVSGAHIHAAPRGSNGLVIHSLNGADGTYCGVTQRLTDAQVASLKAGQMYLNIHTAQFIGGEIRGQIERTDVDLGTFMDGSQQVPPVNTGAEGSACVEINADMSVTYTVTTTGLSGVAAHIHTAPAGANGPITVNLIGGPRIWQGTSLPLTSADIANARAGNWYVNIHTLANPGGEIRGQLAVPALPSTYGAGCPDPLFAVGEIGAEGFACVGGRVTITMQRLSGPSVGVLALGANRENFGGLPLPLELGLVGAGGCFLLQDMVLTLPASGGPNGCARTTLPVPFEPALREQQLYAQWLMVSGGRLVTTNGLSLPVQ